MREVDKSREENHIVDVSSTEVGRVLGDDQPADAGSLLLKNESRNYVAGPNEPTSPANKKSSTDIGDYHPRKYAISSFALEVAASSDDTSELLQNRSENISVITNSST